MEIMKLSSIRYHIERILFEQFGIPKTKGMDISKSLLKKYLPTKPVIVDCGAYDGQDSLALHRVLNGSIHCFEPVPSVYTRLLEGTRKIKEIHTYNLALSDVDGISNFYVSGGESDGSSSLMQPHMHLKDHPRVTFNEVISVQTKSLDSWAKDNNITHVDLLWLDMQGFELSMLKASRIILDTVKVIHTEVSTRETYKNASLYSDVKTFLESKGFTMIIEAIPAGWDMGNVLFVKKHN